MGWTDKLAEFLRLNDGEQAYVGYPQMQVGLNKPRQAGYATGFLEGATGMDSMQPKNPITDPNYSAYEQGKNTGEGVGIAAMAIPGYVAALKASAPKAYNMLENYMVKTGGIQPMIAYHGTPHNILGKFDISKVGTGEGAQHYGHGIYFAESPTIAGEYKGSDAVKLFANGVETESPVAKQIVRYGSPEEYIRNMEKVVAKKTKTLNSASKEEIIPGLSDYDMAKMDLDNLLKKIDEAKSYNSVETRPVGNLYKVDIPDAEIPYYMDWYEKLKNQTPQVKKSLGITEDEFGNFKVPQSGTNYAFSPQMSGGEFYSELASILKSSKEASKILNQMGIKGNKYENFQIKQGAGGGTYNYVSFDPSTIEILEQNSKPVSRKELIEKQINKLPDDYNKLSTMATEAYENLRKNPSKETHDYYKMIMEARENAPLNNPKNVKEIPISVEESYKGQHQAPMRDSGKPLHDLTDVYPEDFYSHKAVQYYGTGSDRDAYVINQLQSLRGRPNAEVWMYRAVPKNAESAINKGDWVTTDRQYAKEHGESALNGDYKIIKRKAYARDLYTNGDSPFEMGYDPQPAVSRRQLLEKQLKD